MIPSQYSKYESFIQKYDNTFHRIKKIVLSFFIFTIIASLFLIGVCIGYFASIISNEQSIENNYLFSQVVDLPDMSEHISETTDLLAYFDEPEPPLIAGPSEVTPYLSKAIVASEDAQFYEHNGILPKAILRAMYQDLFDQEGATGGSTITQQLIKNQLLTNEKTYDRKAKEIMYAMRIEKLLTKDEIMYIYMNIVPFGYDHNGQHLTGITSASYGIFGKAPIDLSISEAAYLAGIIQSPYYYTPYDEDGNFRGIEITKPSIDRQKYVLKRMLIEKQITPKQYKNALNDNLYDRILKSKT
ncbi:biosynthetic peptidoglycan transglycosylase [Staphylococcus felis]|uniref:biosynthetic peptidoglycan transglycosylase n=1 Tax=Staphylococcus felis TaxID=46127 RepID=UPI000E264095|nr:biosynthetic peptidoglycan transglycosylase [Staphylococcus felis]REI35149.1 transglycosylase [Staphylococcus felis]